MIYLGVRALGVWRGVGGKVAVVSISRGGGIGGSLMGCRKRLRVFLVSVAVFE